MQSLTICVLQISARQTNTLVIILLIIIGVYVKFVISHNDQFCRMQEGNLEVWASFHMVYQSEGTFKNFTIF